MKKDEAMDTKTSHTHDGHRERLKELFLKTGLDSFSPHSALELLLFYAIPRKDTNALAHKLIRKFGSFSAVFDAPMEELLRVDGIGYSAAVFIKIIPQLCRLYQEDLDRGKKMICDYDDAGRYLLKKFIGRKNEIVVLMLLDSSERILFCGTVSEGNANSANIYIKEIVRLAVQYNAAYAILAHNHPSGSCLPSRQDMDTTRWVYDALQTVEVRLIDHIVVSGNNYLSIADSKILPELFNQDEEPADEAGESDEDTE